jgi:hypothetical protein
MMATPHPDTSAVLVLELDDDGLRAMRAVLVARPPLASYVVRDSEGIDDVLGITTGWTRNTS